MNNTQLLQAESVRIAKNRESGALALGTGLAAVTLLTPTIATAQVDPVADLNTQVTALDGLADNAIPVATGVIAFMIGALVVGRVMRS